MTSKKNLLTKPTALTLTELDNVVQRAEDSIESMALRVQKSNALMRVPEYIADMVIPSGTKPSNLNPFVCVMRLKKIMAAEGKIGHPAYKLEQVLETSDAYITPTTVVAVDEKDVRTDHPVVLGLLLDKKNEVGKITSAITSSLISSFVRTDDEGTCDIVNYRPDLTEIESPDFIRFKVFLRCNIPSLTLARNDMFRTLAAKGNEPVALKLHSDVGHIFPNYLSNDSVNEAMIKYYEKIKKTPPENMDIKTCNMGVRGVRMTDDYDRAWKYHLACTGIRGGRKSSLTSGYEMFEMTRVLSENLGIVRDFINITTEFGTKTVILNNINALTREQIRVLVFNGLRIVIKDSTYPAFADAPGLYGDVSDDTAITFLSYGDAEMKPYYEQRKICYRTDAVKLALERFQRHARAFAYFPIVPEVKGCMLFPSALAETMQCLVATRTEKAMTVFTIEVLLNRATAADSVKTNFLIDRRPFCTMDVCRDWVNWIKPIAYPRMRPVDKSKKFGMEKLDAGKVPEKIEIDYNEFSVMVEKYVPGAESDLVVTLRQAKDWKDLAPELIRYYIFGDVGIEAETSAFFSIIYQINPSIEEVIDVLASFGHDRSKMERMLKQCRKEVMKRNRESDSDRGQSDDDAGDGDEASVTDDDEEEKEKKKKPLPDKVKKQEVKLEVTDYEDLFGGCQMNVLPIKKEKK